MGELITVYLSILSICVSEIFFFFCFVVVLIRGARCQESRAATCRISLLQLVEYPGHSLLVLNVVDQGFAEVHAHVLQVCHIKMKARLSAAVRPKERDFERETVHQLELLPHDASRRRFLTLINLERAILEAEHIEVLAK